GADFLERCRQPRRFMLVDPLHPELEGRDRPGLQRRLERVRKGAGNVERRDEIELARRTARIALELPGEIWRELVHHARLSSRRLTAAVKPAGSSSRWAMAATLRLRLDNGWSSSSITFG